MGHTALAVWSSTNFASGSKPKITFWFDSRPDRNKEYSSMKFGTYSLPCFNEFYDLFYSGGTKCIPSNIAELLTVRSLAFWLSDDGTFDKLNQVVVLCTDSFTLEEVELLINVLNDKWNLECYKKKTSISNYRIVIPRRSLLVLQSLLGPIMPPMMRYRIGL